MKEHIGYQYHSRVEGYHWCVNIMDPMGRMVVDERINTLIEGVVPSEDAIRSYICIVSYGMVMRFINYVGREDR